MTKLDSKETMPLIVKDNHIEDLVIAFRNFYAKRTDKKFIIRDKNKISFYSKTLIQLITNVSKSNPITKNNLRNVGILLCIPSVEKIAAEFKTDLYESNALLLHSIAMSQTKLVDSLLKSPNIRRCFILERAAQEKALYLSVHTQNVEVFNMLIKFKSVMKLLMRGDNIELIMKAVACQEIFNKILFCEFKKWERSLSTGEPDSMNASLNFFNTLLNTFYIYNYLVFIKSNKEMLKIANMYSKHIVALKHDFYKNNHGETFDLKDTYLTNAIQIILDYLFACYICMNALGEKNIRLVHCFDNIKRHITVRVPYEADIYCASNVANNFFSIPSVLATFKHKIDLFMSSIDIEKYSKILALVESKEEGNEDLNQIAHNIIAYHINYLFQRLDDSNNPENNDVFNLTDHRMKSIAYMTLKHLIRVWSDSNNNLVLILKILKIPVISKIVAYNNKELLELAASKGICDLVKELLGNKTIININNSLYYAAQEGHYELVNDLLSHEAMLSSIKKYGYTLLGKAIIDQQRDVALKLLEFPEILDEAENKQEYEDYVVPCINSHRVRLDENRQDEKFYFDDESSIYIYYIVLRRLIRNFNYDPNLELISYLLAHDNINELVCSKIEELLYIALVLGNIDILDILLQLPNIQMDIDNIGTQLLCAAVDLNLIDFTIRLLQVQFIYDNADANANEALNLARQNNNFAIEALLLEVPAVLMRYAENLATSEINTHTAFIHDSATRSSKKLIAKYDVNDFKIEMINFKHLFEYKDILKESGNMLELKKLISNSMIIPLELLPSDELIESSIDDATNFLMKSEFVDAASNISLTDVFKSILVGISKFSDEDRKRNAYLMLISQIYQLGNEYARNEKACPAGFFNGIIYSQVSILSEEIVFDVQTIGVAAVSLNNLMRIHIKKIFDSGICATAQELENEMSNNSSSHGIEIMRVHIQDYFRLFGYEHPNDAIGMADEVVSQQCQKIYGCEPYKLFEKLPISCEVLFARQFIINKIKDFVCKVLQHGNFMDYEEFNFEIKAELKSDNMTQIALNIVRETIFKYPNLFGYLTSEGVKRANDTDLERKFSEVFNCETKNLFGAYQVDYKKIFSEYKNANLKSKEEQTEVLVAANRRSPRP